MEDNLIRDINPLANLTNLRRLGMLRNQVTDINVLAGLVNLEYLRLAGNPITDTSPLRSLPQLTDVDVHISSPPQRENTQPQGDSGQLQQQQPTTNPQPQPQPQPTTNPQPQPLMIGLSSVYPNTPSSPLAECIIPPTIGFPTLAHSHIFLWISD